MGRPTQFHNISHGSVTLHEEKDEDEEVRRRMAAAQDKRSLVASPCASSASSNSWPFPISDHENLLIILSDLELSSKREREQWSTESQNLRDQIVDLNYTIHRL